MLRRSFWFPVPNKPYGLCGCKATFEEEEEDTQSSGAM